MKSYDNCLSLTDLFAQHNTLKFHPHCCKWQDFFFFFFFFFLVEAFLFLPFSHSLLIICCPKKGKTSIIKYWNVLIARFVLKWGFHIMISCLCFQEQLLFMFCQGEIPISSLKIKFLLSLIIILCLSYLFPALLQIEFKMTCKRQSVIFGGSVSYTHLRAHET